MLKLLKSRDVVLRRLARACAAALLLATCGGCGQQGLPVAPTSGKVTIDGRDVPQGSVIFIPAKGRSATGTIRPDGTFTLTTYRPNDGALLGLHQVAISGAEVGEDFDPRKLEQSVKWLVPPRYRDPTTSGLSFEVAEGRENFAEFKLSSTSASPTSPSP